MAPEPSYCLLVAGMASGPIGHLLCWERHEHDGSRWAWVSWIQQTSARAGHKIVCVPAQSLTPLETPGALPAGTPHDLRQRWAGQAVV